MSYKLQVGSKQKTKKTLCTFVKTLYVPMWLKKTKILQYYRLEILRPFNFSIIQLFIFAICTILFSTCEKEITNVTKVVLNKDELELQRGKTETLIATVYPRSADNQELTWSSNNIAVATVNDNGLVTAISRGETTITVTSKDSNKQDFCNVTIIDMPELTTSVANNITTVSAILGGNISNTGTPSYSERGVCYSTSQHPTTTNFKKVILGTGTGIFSMEITDLIPSTIYYVRAYAINVTGTAYGNEESFKTFGLPVLTTNVASNIYTTGVILSGKITNSGTPLFTERGVCYSTHQNPTIADNKTVITGVLNESFYTEITDLKVSTTYYVRAYATNTEGTGYGNEISFTTSSINIEMIFVEGGTFTMGRFGDLVEPNEKPGHRVTLSSFNIGKYEVTEGEWFTVMGKNQSIEPKGDNYPVEGVSWNDVQVFIVKLNTLTGKNYRLPTEAEWEYAAQGGKQTIIYDYSGGNYLKDLGWYYDNSGGSKRITGTKAPNQLGIYDMSGNVSEWCNDWYGLYSSDEQTDPVGPLSGNYRVIRGGNFYSGDYSCRVSTRTSLLPIYFYSVVGFRLVLP